jgi:hypothetical protein
MLFRPRQAASLTSSPEGLDHRELLAISCSMARDALRSDDDSLGIAPIEAVSYGVPVILSDMPCCAGIWRHGVNALLYPVGWNRLVIADADRQPATARAAGGGRTVGGGASPPRTTALFGALLAEGGRRRLSGA